MKRNSMDIEELVDKYFEGETTADEERRLRAYFVSGKVSERLKIYEPIWAYFDEEIHKSGKPAKPFTIKKLCYFVSGLAAAILLLMGLRQEFWLSGAEDICLCSPSYVIINGRCYTDTQKVHALAFEALREVANDEVFYPGIGSADESE
ncbi:MAG: hypothetical protein LBJ39_06010 [Tannerellaceae bacterium]|jgi:hypothetical protein|nr:hypothetical protein [Tannerellaceae bacterium]